MGGLEEFGSMRSSFVEGVRLLMEEFESNSDSWDESSILGMEQVLVSLLDDGVCVATPFQLSENIKSAIRQSAVEWDFESFAQVGGSGFIGNVWRLMKGNGRTRGIKRNHSGDELEEGYVVQDKRVRFHLDISGACESFKSILLANYSECSLELSILNNESSVTRDATELAWEAITNQSNEVQQLITEAEQALASLEQVRDNASESDESWNGELLLLTSTDISDTESDSGISHVSGDGLIIENSCVIASFSALKRSKSPQR